MSSVRQNLRAQWLVSITAVTLFGIKLAAWLMVPLLAWTMFATLLNYEFLRLNPQFDGANPTQAQQRIEI